MFGEIAHPTADGTPVNLQTALRVNGMPPGKTVELEKWKAVLSDLGDEGLPIAVLYLFLFI